MSRASVVLPHCRGPTSATTRLRLRAARTRKSRLERGITLLSYHENRSTDARISWLICTNRRELTCWRRLQDQIRFTAARDRPCRRNLAEGSWQMAETGDWWLGYKTESWQFAVHRRQNRGSWVAAPGLRYAVCFCRSATTLGRNIESIVSAKTTTILSSWHDSLLREVRGALYNSLIVWDKERWHGTCENLSSLTHGFQLHEWRKRPCEESFL